MKLSLNPKFDFLKDKQRASLHQDIMASPHFQEAAKGALLLYQINLPLVGEGQSAVASVKLKGAKEFLDILMNFGNPEMPNRQTQEEPLNRV